MQNTRTACARMWMCMTKTERRNCHATTTATTKTIQRLKRRSPALASHDVDDRSRLSIRIRSTAFRLLAGCVHVSSRARTRMCRATSPALTHRQISNSLSPFSLPPSTEQYQADLTAQLPPTPGAAQAKHAPTDEGGAHRTGSRTSLSHLHSHLHRSNISTAAHAVASVRAHHNAVSPSRARCSTARPQSTYRDPGPHAYHKRMFRRPPGCP